jgi:hypothetical protein
VVSLRLEQKPSVQDLEEQVAYEWAFEAAATIAIYRVRACDLHFSMYVTGNSTPDSTPVGSIDRARGLGEVASRKARLRERTDRATYIHLSSDEFTLSSHERT